jgi:hypothetical protein
MSTVSLEEYRAKKQAVPTYLREFDGDRQVGRVTSFIQDLLKIGAKSYR